MSIKTELHLYTAYTYFHNFPSGFFVNNSVENFPPSTNDYHKQTELYIIPQLTIQC